VRAKREEIGDVFHLSVSHGSMVANHSELEQIDDLLAHADEQMYRTKRARRHAARHLA
jgi:GGDEF domain-containing protein